MQLIDIEMLEAGGYYWARRKSVRGAPAGPSPDVEIIRISTVFGTAREFWAVALMGTDQHFGLEEFDIFHKVAAHSVAAPEAEFRQNPFSKALSH